MKQLRHLKTWRAQPIYAHRMLRPLVSMLGELAEMFDAVGRELDDKRWCDASDLLNAAARLLRGPVSDADEIPSRNAGDAG